MNDETILNEIRKLLKGQSKKKITFETKVKDIGLDSLDMIDLIMEAEDKFNIHIPDAKLLEIITFADLINEIKLLIK